MLLTLSGIHSPHFQQSNRTTIDVNSAETVSRPYRYSSSGY